MNRRQFLALIWAGSFDDFCLSRSFLADNAEKLMGVAKAGRVSVEALVTWEDLIAGVEMKADDEDMIADKELELLKCSPRRMAQDIGLRDRIGKGTVALSQLEPSSKNVRVCGRILEIGKRSGKKSDYAYLQLNDGTALLRCLAFKENVIDQLEEIGPQAAVVLQGDASEDGSAFFIRKVVNSYSDDKG
jgi:DNA polymerase III alpha subunit